MELDIPQLKTENPLSEIDPKYSMTPFWDQSKILCHMNNNDYIALRSWLPDTTLTLLYSQSRDGSDSEAFHRRCNGRSNTLTVVRAANSGQILGGYADVAWSSSHTYLRSQKAWLFALTNQCHSKNKNEAEEEEKKKEGESIAFFSKKEPSPDIPAEASPPTQEEEPSLPTPPSPKKEQSKPFDKDQPVRLPLVLMNELTAICSRGDAGPTFGSTHDLLINGGLTRDGTRLSYCCAGVTYCFPSNFQKRSRFLAGTPTFVAEEVEVFQLATYGGVPVSPPAQNPSIQRQMLPSSRVPSPLPNPSQSNPSSAVPPAIAAPQVPRQPEGVFPTTSQSGAFQLQQRYTQQLMQFQQLLSSQQLPPQQVAYVQQQIKQIQQSLYNIQHSQAQQQIQMQQMHAQQQLLNMQQGGQGASSGPMGANPQMGANQPMGVNPQIGGTQQIGAAPMNVMSGSQQIGSNQPMGVSAVGTNLIPGNQGIGASQGVVPNQGMAGSQGMGVNAQMGGVQQQLPSIQQQMPLIQQGQGMPTLPPPSTSPTGAAPVLPAPIGNQALETGSLLSSMSSDDVLDE